MSENNETRSNKRVKRLKIEILIIVAILIILPNVISIITLIRQMALQKEINELESKLSVLTLNLSDAGSTRESRLTDLASLGLEDEWDDFYEKKQEVADWDNIDNVVWTFADSGEKDVHKVYLTFDDGPSSNTEEILDILDEYGVKATFFVVGKEDETSLNLYREIVERGHTLGMHSYSHVYSDIYSSETAFLNDYRKISDLLLEATGVRPVFYRFPGGSSNTVSSVDMHVYIDCLSDMGVTYFDWNVSSGDASGSKMDVDTLVENSLIGIEDRSTSVILMHDAADKDTTVEALPQIIEAIQNMDDTVILPITSETELVQHVQ